MSNDESTFICVLVDEVESLAGRRDSSTDGSDCKDSMRATNQLLTALDRLSHRPNVLVLCTSNMWNAIVSLRRQTLDIGSSGIDTSLTGPSLLGPSRRQATHFEPVPGS